MVWGGWVGGWWWRFVVVVLSTLVGLSTLYFVCAQYFEYNMFGLSIVFCPRV